ncbi:MAG: ABC transporter ATP-binding protein [Thermomicrobiales bacterium]|nr:ABC transporter ATP-binding protein [Thermomicrobiales bacterium]
MASRSVTAPQSRFNPIDDWRRLIGPVILVFAFIYPLIDSWLGLRQLGKLEGMLILVILAMGLNIVVGYAGLLDLGYAAFFAIGAYTMAFLTSPASFFVRKGWVPEFMQNFWPAMAVSWGVAAIFGVILGAPTLRLRGDYLAIVTLGFGEIVPNFFLNAVSITGGTQGLNRVGMPPAISIPFTDITLRFGPTDQRNWYWLMLVVVLFTLFLSLRFHNSRLGRSWVAVREDEIAAASMGVNLVRTKLWAFAMGASFAGFAGSIFSSAFQFVHPDQFAFSVSVMVLAMVILGGIGNVYGVILGAMLIGGFDRILAEQLNRPLHWFGEAVNSEGIQGHDVGSDRFLVFGLALVIMMLWRPEGILPSKRRKLEFHEHDHVEEGVT